MAYVPNAGDTSQPVESQSVESAALEFRTLKTLVARGLRVPEATIGDIPTAAARAGKVLGFDAAGQPVEVEVSGVSDPSLRADLAASGGVGLVNGAARSGANTDITSLSALTSINGRQLAGMCNRVINGNFSINQRSVSGVVTLAAGAYGHDRWKAGASGCTYSFVTTANVTTLTITAGSLIQVIEGLNLESGTFSLSWTGTATGKIGAGSFSVPGVTGVITGGTNTNLEFSTGTLSNVQLELGSVATVFEQRPYGLELALCQRYYEVVSHAGFTLDAVTGFNLDNGSSWNRQLPFKQPKRVIPSIIGSFDSTGFIPAPGYMADVNSAYIGKGGKYGVTTESGGNPYVYGVMIRASAEL